MIAALLLALIVIDPDAQTIDPGDFAVVTTSTTPIESTTTTSDTSTTSSSESSTSTVESTTTTTTIASGLEWFVSVTGSDATGDGRRTNPFRTGNKAIAIATDGDAIVLLDNPDSAPHAAIVVGKPGLTVRCETEGQCAIVTNGVPGIEITAPRTTLIGVAVKSVDNATGRPHNIFVHDTNHVTIRRCLGGWNNRLTNAHLFRFENVTDSEISEVGCLQHSRHCISDHGGDRNRILRNWINGMGYVEVGSNPPGGTSRESIACYPCSHALIANNIIEGTKDWGIVIEGTKPMPGNRVIGNVVAGTYLGAKVYSRPNGYPVDTLVEDLVVSQIGPSFDVRDQVSINTTYRRVTAFSGTLSFEVDNPTKSSAQLACTDVPGTPSIAIRDSILGKLAIEACTGKTRGCTVTNTSAESSTIMAGCTVSGLTSGVPALLGDAGLGKRLVIPINGKGADVRCVIADDGTRTTEDLWSPLGAFRFCPPRRAGWNDGAESCETYASRRLNHKPDGTGAPLNLLACTP